MSARPVPPTAPRFDRKFIEDHQLLQRYLEGKLPVKLWLCAPDGKRIDSTSNWPAFKTAQYPKLKSTLQKKYPGTTWL